MFFACMCCMFICWVHLCVHVCLVVSYVYVLLIACVLFEWLCVSSDLDVCCLVFVVCMHCMFVACSVCVFAWLICTFVVCTWVRFGWLIVAYLLGACVFVACLVYVFAWHGWFADLLHVWFFWIVCLCLCFLLHVCDLHDWVLGLADCCMMCCLFVKHTMCFVFAWLYLAVFVASCGYDLHNLFHFHCLLHACISCCCVFAWMVCMCVVCMCFYVIWMIA